MTSLRFWARERPARPRPHLPWRLPGRFTDQGRSRTSASPHPDPAPALGGSVHRPGEVVGLRLPAPVLGGGSRTPRFPSPGHADESTSGPPRHPPPTYIMNRETYPRLPNPCSALSLSPLAADVILGLACPRTCCEGPALALVARVPRTHRATNSEACGPQSDVARCRPCFPACPPRRAGSSGQARG